MERYQITPLEYRLYSHYQQHGIYYPADMDLELIAASFGIDLSFYNGPTFADWDDAPDGNKLIVLDRRLSEEEQRAHFFHELCHILRHCGNQCRLPKLFVQLQEIQAAQFQLAAALPAYMLQRYSDPSPNDVAEEFRLPISLVRKRLEQIHARIVSREFHRKLYSNIYRLRGSSNESSNIHPCQHRPPSG